MSKETISSIIRQTPTVKKKTFPTKQLLIPGRPDRRVTERQHMHGKVLQVETLVWRTQQLGQNKTANQPVDYPFILDSCRRIGISP